MTVKCAENLAGKYAEAIDKNTSSVLVSEAEPPAAAAQLSPLCLFADLHENVTAEYDCGGLPQEIYAIAVIVFLKMSEPFLVPAMPKYTQWHTRNHPKHLPR